MSNSTDFFLGLLRQESPTSVVITEQFARELVSACEIEFDSTMTGNSVAGIPVEIQPDGYGFEMKLASGSYLLFGIAEGLGNGRAQDTKGEALDG